MIINLRLVKLNEIIVVNSFSKYFCMPGWRLGWVIVPKSLTKNLLKLSQNIFISSGNIAQFAAIKAFDCIKSFDKIVKNYKKIEINHQKF